MGIERFLFNDPTADILKKSLDIHAHRADVIASNLANTDTPGYKARDVDFRAALQDAIDQSDPGGLRATNPRHFERDDLAFTFEIEQDVENDSIRVDDNTVNPDKELQKMAESQLMYNASVTAMARKMKIINQALSGKV